MIKKQKLSKEEKEAIKFQKSIEKVELAKKKENEERLFLNQKRKDMMLADSKVKQAFSELLIADAVEKKIDQKRANGASLASVNSDFVVAEEKYSKASFLYDEALQIYEKYNDSNARECKKNRSFCYKKSAEMRRKQTIRVRV